MGHRIEGKSIRRRFLEYLQRINNMKSRILKVAIHHNLIKRKKIKGLKKKIM